MAAAITLWGCGGDESGGPGTGGKGGGGGKGGAAGGKGGSAGSATTGTGGAVVTGTGGSTSGSGGSSTGSGGSTGTGGATGGSTGTGGAVGGSTGTGGAIGGSTGTGGTTPECTNGTSCALLSAGGASGALSGVCVNGACANCAADSACQTAYGAGHICLGTGAAANCVTGECHQHSDCNGKLCSAATNFCTNCSGDADCTTALGANRVCQNGTCVGGSCSNNSQCPTGQICQASACVTCNNSDSACTTSYGAGYICVSNSCVMGTCHDNSECTTGNQVCTASHVCGPCTTDGQCGTGKICNGTGASATCITGDCHASNDCSNGRLCVSNKCTDCTLDSQCANGQLCLSGGCTTGNCRTANNCSGGQVCNNNNCTTCTTDGQCVSGYGADHICNGSGACIMGNCHTAGTCGATNQICNTSTLFCEGCTSDPQCAAEYDNSRICISSVCVVGNCHTTAMNCSSTSHICNLTTHACEGCTTDAQCSDVANYGPNHICNGSGACIVGNCHAAADCNDATQVCKNNTCGMCSSNADCTGAYGAGHVCSGGSCVSGNCNSSSECGNNQLCVNHSCTACTTDAQCVADTTYGAMHICLGTGSNAQCVAGDCHDKSSDCATAGQMCGLTTPHVCGGCNASDAACQADARYGTSTICLSNLCVTGDCHDTSNDCPTGQLCGVSTQHTCGACATDLQCTTDSRYGSKDICYQGTCQAGDCHAKSDDCTGANQGRVCGVSTALVCGACSSDTQCTSDPFYGPTTICKTAVAPDQGTCVTAACSNNNAKCTANGADFCCGGACVPGNCCNNTDCANNPQFGAGYACTGNTCTHCDAIASNTYYVDPVNGDDVAATGSGKSGGVGVGACSFRTLTRAMQVIGTFAGAGTKVVIVGSGTTPRGLAASEVMPVTVQPNVTVTTTGGPITIVLPAATNQANPTNTSGFVLQNNGAGVVGDPAAPLIIDGNNNTSGYAVSVLGSGTMSLSNVTIQNTRAHAINVTAATLNIGAGVVVKGAGIAAQPRNGMNISGGVVNINVPSGTPTQFTANRSYGIEVSALGSLNVTGVAVKPPTGNGTVVVSSNQGLAGLYIHQTAGATLATNSLTGLLAWNNGTDGARFGGGSKIKVRDSVFGANARYGVFIVQGNGGGPGQQRDLSQIDLGLGGTTPDYGKNYLQTPTSGSVLGHNETTGLCVAIGGAATNGGTLNAAGNFMVFGTGTGTQVDCSTTAQTVTKGPTCTGGASLGIAAGTTVNVVLSQCN